MDREGREQFLRKLTKPSDRRRVLFLFLTVVCLSHWVFFVFTFVSFLIFLLSWKSEEGGEGVEESLGPLGARQAWPLGGET